MEMTVIALQGRPIRLGIRRHAQARRISLRLSAARDSIILTLPRRASVASGLRFFHAKSAWILAHVEPESAIALADGAVIPILGENCVICHKQGRGIAAINDKSELHIYGDPAFTARRVRDFLKKHLLAECAQRAESMAAQLGKKPRDVKIRDTRSRWGSCSAKGGLTFNWRLVLAPTQVVDYLVAHEVAHLAEMNHGPRFWQVVEELCPHYKAARKWLKAEGHRLHRYG